MATTIMMGSSLWFLLAICSGLSSAMQRLDDEMAEIRHELGGVSLAAATIDANGRICAAGADGERVLGSGFPVDAIDGRWQVGSCTKSMTAVLMAMLLEEGGLGEGITWQSTLQDVLPPSLQNSASPYNLVRLEQLLSMTAGLPRDAPDWQSYGARGSPLRNQRHAAARDALSSQPVNPPGTTFLYSNWGYVLAGVILEAHTDQLWEQLVMERIFAPLGIQLNAEADFGIPRGDNDAWGHEGRLIGGYIPCNPFHGACHGFERVQGPCGGFTGTTRAMATYLSWHVRCHNGNLKASDPQLTSETCRKLHTPVNSTLSPYGLGWGCYERDWAGEALACGHLGSIGTWVYDMWIAPGINRSFVAMANSRSFSLRPSSWKETRSTDRAVVYMIQSDIECHEEDVWEVTS